MKVARCLEILVISVSFSGQGSHEPGKPGNLELSGNFVNLEKSGNLRYGQGIFFYNMSHGSRLAY